MSTVQELPPRERILATADELFYQKGIHGVGVDDIVAGSGVAKMTLYKHFASKDLLIAACLRRRSELWQSWLRESVEKRTPVPSQRLLAVFDALAEWFSRTDFRGCPFINAAAGLPDPAHPACQVVHDHKEAVRSYLRKLARNTGVRSSEELADSLFLLVEGATVAGQLGGGYRVAQRARDAAAMLIKLAR